jgi:uncharacterized protein (DUF433 family)
MGERQNINWRERITRDPAVCHGRACIKGTRVMVSVVLDNLAQGFTEAQILESYPALTLEDIRAAVAYGAELAREMVVSAGSGAED